MNSGWPRWTFTNQTQITECRVLCPHWQVNTCEWVYDAGVRLCLHQRREVASGEHWGQGDGSYCYSWHQTRWGVHFTYLLFCKSSPWGELILTDRPLFIVPDSAHTDDPEELNKVLSSKVEELSEADREYFYSLADCKVIYCCCDDMSHHTFSLECWE